MKLIVAVSGGVDSVVLLDRLVREAQHDLIVAHFDHGIRVDSGEDAEFVGQLAAQYGLPFEVRREELGESASEELARTRRYAFLRQVATKHQAVIATGHHMNDIAETIAINLQRGTGWRGVACLASDTYRPLLHMTKEEIVSCARENQLAWREDSTNLSDAYLRNRLRPLLRDEERVRQLAALRARQVELRDEIQRELAVLSLNPPYSRHFFIMAGATEALECLRHITKGRLTRPQLERARIAVAVMRAGSRFEAGGGLLFVFTQRHFTLQNSTE